MPSSIFGQGLTNPRHLIREPGTELFYVTEDSTKEVWCFTEHCEHPIRRISGKFTNPNGIAFSRDGDLLVSDYGDGVVYRFADDATQETVIVGLVNPYGIAVDAQGNVVVADAGNEAIKVFSPQYDLLHEFKPGFRPVDVALQSDGLVVIGYSGEIAILDPNTGNRRHFLQSSYAYTIGVAVDSEDRIYVTQHLGAQIAVFGSNLTPMGPIEGLPELSLAWGIKAAGGENEVRLYVAEQGRMRVYPVHFKLRPVHKTDT